MNIFTNKNLILKIVIALVIVILFNFSAPTMSQAVTIGGVLFEPIKDLVLTIADGAVWLIQKIVFDTDVSLMKLEYDKSWFSAAAGAIAGFIAGAVAIVVGVVAAPFSGGLSLAAVAAGIKIIGTTIIAVGVTYFAVSYIVAQALPPTFYIPMYAISPAEIFSNKIPMLDVNFFNPRTNEYYESLEASTPETGGEEDTNTEDDDTPRSAAAQLQAVISSWYFIIRNFSLIALLSILVYIGIRIIVSSSAQDKAKYKQRFFDWVVAICLLFFLHYIMSFAMTVTQLIIDSLEFVNKPYYIAVGDSETKLKDYQYDTATDADGESVFDGSLADSFRDQGIIVDNTDGDGEIFLWPTNLMGKARIELQLEPKEEMSEDDILVRQFGYTIIFLALVIYTIIFLFRYLKRLLMLAFLTIIAPFVAMTYPLDKLHDGNAQAFNMWLKEYIFNLLIQPVHLILYSILIGSAIDFVADNLLYALAALAFISQAEKIMRRFFGFDKASTLDAGSALGGALAMQGINQLRRLGGGNKKGNKDGNGNGNAQQGRIRQNRRPEAGQSTQELLAAEYGGNQPRQAANTQQVEPPDNSNTQQAIDPAEAERQRALDKYSSEGFGQNANGEYFNPWTDEYDADYDPTKDTSYNEDLLGRQEALQKYKNEGFGQNAFGEYFNPWIDEYDPDYDPTQDKEYNSRIREATTPEQVSPPAPPTPTQPRVATRNDLQQMAQNNNNQRKRSVLRGVGAVAGSAAKYALPRAGKLMVKGTAAGALGMVGMAAGLTTGDPGNVLKYSAAGAGAGWIAAGGVMNGTGGIPDKLGEVGRNAAETFAEGYGGKEAVEELDKKTADWAARHNKERRKLYENKLNIQKKDVDQAMDDAQKYRDAGITDDDLIIKAMKAEGFDQDRGSRQRVILAGLASEVGTDKKELERMKKGLEDQGIEKKEIKKYEDAIKKMNDWTF